MKKLNAVGVIPKPINDRAEYLPLTGSEFVITGRLNSLSRQEAEARIRALGGSTKNDITRKTDYLVVGIEPGSKLNRASKLAIKQIDEDELLDLLKQEENTGDK